MLLVTCEGRRLVQELIESGRAKNLHEAFTLLEELMGLFYETTKRLDRQALNEPRFRAILLTFSETLIQLTEEELASAIEASEQLTSGRALTRTLCETESGPLQVAFEAAKPRHFEPMRTVLGTG